MIEVNNLQHHCVGVWRDRMPMTSQCQGGADNNNFHDNFLVKYSVRCILRSVEFKCHPSTALVA